MDVKVSSKKDSRAQDEIRRATEGKRSSSSRSRRNTSQEDEELRDQLTEALSNILLGEKIPLDVVNSETGEIIIPANRKITKTLLRKLAEVYDRIEIDPSPIRNKINEIIGQFKRSSMTSRCSSTRKPNAPKPGEGTSILAS
jgi:DNA-directed RNA polymerase subunit beta